MEEEKENVEEVEEAKEDSEKEEVEEKEEDSELNDSKSGKQEIQAKWLIGILALFIIMVFIGAWISSESKNFDYIGLNWDKEKFGQLYVYSTLLQGQGVVGQPINLKFILKNDPRKLEVPVEGDVFVFSKMPTFLAMDLESGIDECEPTALISFGYHMAGLGYDLQTAAITNETAEENDLEFMNCEISRLNTIMTLTTGNESKITRGEGDERNCYTLTVANCELDEVMEQFEIEVLKGILPEPSDSRTEVIY